VEFDFFKLMQPKDGRQGVTAKRQRCTGRRLVEKLIAGGLAGHFADDGGGLPP